MYGNEETETILNGFRVSAITFLMGVFYPDCCVFSFPVAFSLNLFDLTKL